MNFYSIAKVFYDHGKIYTENHDLVTNLGRRQILSGLQNVILFLFVQRSTLKSRALGPIFRGSQRSFKVLFVFTIKHEIRLSLVQMFNDNMYK